MTNRDNLIDNLAIMIDAGISIPDIFKSLGKETRSSSDKKKLNALEQEIESGTPFWRALVKENIFPEYTLAILRIGEESGTLPESMRVVSIEQQKRRETESKIRSALTYPAIIFILLVIVGSAIMWFIIPKVASIYSSLNLKLPLITQLFIKSSHIITVYGIFIFPFFITIILLIFYLLFVNHKTRFLGEAILFQFPMTRAIIRELNLVHITYLLGTLLQSGIPIREALSSVRQGTSSAKYHHLIAHLSKQIEEGDTFATAFSKYKGIDKLIPPTVQQMMSASERSGKLPESILKISSLREEKLNVATRDLPTILEPALILIIGVLITFLTLALILPSYNLINELDNTQTTEAPKNSPTPDSTPAISGNVTNQEVANPPGDDVPIQLSH